MAMLNKCPFCGEEYGDAEEHMDKCPSTFRGACGKFAEARDELIEIILDEVRKLFRIKK